MKQQVSALLWGEDLPGGDQAREIAEVPYEVPVVPRGETSCPVCKQVFKTHHRVQVHMGIHQGEKFPCGKCGKVLATRRYWTEQTQSCVHGKRVTCLCAGNCLQVLRPCTSTIKPNMGLILLCRKVGLYAHSVPNLSGCEKHGQSTSRIVVLTLIGKVPTFAG